MLIPDKINLLYIEDDEDNADIVFAYLEDSKHTKFNIIHKFTLKEGLEFLEKECKLEEDCEVDVILLDLLLPNSQGVDTYKIVSEKCNFLPIVIISGYEEMACECIKMGAQDYLVKPDINSGFIGRSLKYAIERSRLEKSKIEVEKKFRNLVEVTKAGMYEIDFINNKFVYVNDVICEQLGYTREEMMNIGPYDILTEDSVNRWFKRWEALQRGEYIQNSFEYEAVRKDGSTAWALITAEYIEDKNENIIGANVVAIDITDRKMAEKAAKEKETFIFNELETRIQQWRTEIDQGVIDHKSKIQIIDMSNNAEVN
jgi:hypothetical protein